MSVPTQQPIPQALTSADADSTHPTNSPDNPDNCDNSDNTVTPAVTTHERIARVAAVIFLVIICVAVVWPSGREVAELKDSLGPAFLSQEGKDVVLNLVMLAPATFCAVAGWRDVPWWMWALAGCVVGLSAEVLQSLLPMLERRPSLANVGQNAVGAWAGALAAWYLLRRLHPRPDPYRSRRPADGADRPAESSKEQQRATK